MELSYNPAAVHAALCEDRQRNTVRILGLPEGDAEMPDTALPDETDLPQLDQSENDEDN